MLKFKLSFLMLLLSIGSIITTPLRAEFVPAGSFNPLAGLNQDVEPEVTVELEASHQSVAPNQEFWLALNFSIKDDWHIYWLNPGDTGLPASVIWEKPDQLELSDIHWPTPERFVMSGLVSFGYHHQVTLLIKGKWKGDALMDQPIQLKGKVSWLQCKNVCLPADQDVSAQFSVTETPEWNDGAEVKFAQAQGKLPKMRRDVTWSKNGDSWSLSWPGKTSEAIFFPYDNQGIELNQAFNLEQKQGRSVLSFNVSGREVKELSGVLKVDGMGYEVSLQEVQVSGASQATVSKIHLSWWILASAFLGGLLLNLMPCVLPVLSVKILHILDHEEGQSPLSGALAYTLGVMVSFWALALLLIGFSSAGEQLGWGFQLQNPWMVYGLLVLFVVFALNLFGVFEVGVSLVGIDHKQQGPQAKRGWLNAAFSGVLATISATPCSAPFMGTALGATLTMPPLSSFMVFTSLGLGMAFPFLMAGIFPAWMCFLPKPGAWMLTFKQILGFLLLGTASFLFYVMATLVKDLERLLWVGISLVIISMAVWIWGRFANMGQPKAKGYRALGWVLIALAVYLVQPNPTHVQWLTFSESEVEATLAKGEPVFLDFTASWCLSCMVNEKAVLGKKETFDLLDKRGIVPFKADWSQSDPNITKALNKLGRNSVPVYVYIHPDRPNDPVILPEVLTFDILDSHLKPR